jgi:ribonuclease HI
MDQHADRLTFDGSCDPNPGGRMGWGYQLVFTDGTTDIGQGEAPPAPGNSNNVAEYRGLITGAQAYLATGRLGPLHIQGDSQLVVNQVQGVWRAKKPELAALRREFETIAAAIPQVQIEWVRREQNSAADLLARDPQTATPAPAPESRIYLTTPEQAAIASTVRDTIARLNAHPAPGFNDLARLRSGGRDALSALDLPTLIGQTPAAVVAQVRQALADANGQAVALRWAWRGLALDLAIRKVEVDAVVSARAQTPGARARR